MARTVNTPENPNTESDDLPVQSTDVAANEAAADKEPDAQVRTDKQTKIDEENQKTAEKQIPNTSGEKEGSDLDNSEIAPEDIKLEKTDADTGFFSTKDTAYANLPHADEEVTSGPYDPSVRDNKINKDGTYGPSTAQNS